MKNKDLREITRCMLDVCGCLDAIREGQFVKFGLTRGQHSFLTRIDENPGINQENLSYLLKVDRSTTAKALKKLIDKGYIKKVHPENNKKEWILFTTDEGKKLNDSMEDSVTVPLEKLYSGVSEEELDMFYSILSTMDANIVPSYLDFKKST